MESFMHQTWWLYDLTVLAVLILCIWGGWRRGLISSVAGLLGYAAAAFTLLSGVLTNEKYFYKYDDIRSAILNFKKRILVQKKYPIKYKGKVLALWLCPGLYNLMIRGIRKARDKKAD